MGFGDRAITEEEIQQLLSDIAAGCCFGEYSESGEIYRDVQDLFKRNGIRCMQVHTTLLNKLINENRLTFLEETHPTLPEKRRRVYTLRRG